MSSIARRSITKKGRRLGAALIATGCAITLIGGVAMTAASAADPAVTVQIGTKGVVSQLMPGVTHTHESLLNGGNENAMRSLLAADKRLQNVHIMGFGTDNPEPTKGQYDWSGMDERLAMVKATNGIPVITLCCSPDWMKGGASGQTNWDDIEVAPLPSHYADYAELAKQAAKRYPDVKYFQVWNEMKGMWVGNEFDYVNYTKMYNLVYDAVKSVRPDAELGGPYPTMNKLDDRTKRAVQYWLKNKHGGDFVVLDATLEGSGVHGEPKASDAQRFKNVQQFADANAWVQSQTDLPIWWAEYYLGGDTNAQRLAALDATMLVGQALHNGGGVLIWEPKSDSNGCSMTNCLFTSDGKKLPGYTENQLFLRDFPVGTTVFPITASSDAITGLASSKKVLLVNKTASSVTVKLDGTSRTVGAYGVVSVARSGSSAGSSTTFKPVTTTTRKPSGATSSTTAKPATSTTAPPTTATASTVNDTEFTYSGEWKVAAGDDQSSSKFQGDDHYSFAKGASYALTFTGTQVKLYATVDTHHGKAAVSVDGGTEKIIDLYAAERTTQKLVFTSATLASGSHAVKVRVTGTKNAASSDIVVTADKAVITK